MKKFKKIIFLACFVMLIAVMAIAVSAYDKTGNADVDLTKLPAGTTVNGKEMSGTVSLPLYDLDGDALTYYLDGTNLVSIKTKKIAYVTNDGNKYLRLLKADETDPYGNANAVITPGDIVVLNFQDDTINALNGAENNAGTGVQIQDSTSLQYIYFSDSTKSFLSRQLFSGCKNLKGVYFGENSKLTAFQSKTFENCTSLTKVVLPPNLKDPSSAFMGCTGLKTISLPASVTTLWYTFSGCTSLEEVIFAEGSKLTTIDVQSFLNCGALGSINIPDGVTAINTSAFNGCSKLTSINIPNGVTKIGASAFRSCGKLTSINIPDGVTEIGELAFFQCGLTEVTIPASVTTMGIKVFKECKSLKEVVFAEGFSLKTIYKEMFYGCSKLTSINIPNSITEIGDNAFDYCSSLTSINDPSDPTTVNIPDGVTRIGGYAFDECSSLKRVTLPNSVTNVGQRAFRNCTSLEHINFGASLITFEINTSDSNKSYLFWKCNNLKTVIMPATIVVDGTENYIFSDCSSSIKFFFTGTEAEVTALKTKLTNDKNKMFTNISGDKIVKYDSATDYTSLSGAYIIYDYNKCEAFYSGKHIESDAILAYANGFDKEGTSTYTCTRKCGYSESTVIDPIFTASGYSTKKTNDAIYAGFTVNTTALNNYNAYITAQGENALKYGIVVVNMGTSVAEGADLAFGANGIVNSDKAIQVEINDANFTRFGFTLTGFGDETKALNIVISAYVIESKTDAETETTTVKNVSFVQQESKEVTGIEGINSYYTAEVKANGSETKKLGTMTLTQLLTLTGKGVVTEDTITNGESSGVTT